MDKSDELIDGWKKGIDRWMDGWVMDRWDPTDEWMDKWRKLQEAGTCSCGDVLGIWL